MEESLNFKFFSRIDIMKNTLYRQLSAAEASSLFWPKFYYSWFYVDERTLYNIVTLRQRLGSKIEDRDIEAYNQMRVNSFIKLSFCRNK